MQPHEHPDQANEASGGGSLRGLIESVEAHPGPLVDRVSALIEQTRGFVARQTNAALTLMNWHIGRMIDVEVLDQERAGYGFEIVATLSQQLSERFGRGFDRTNLTRMVRFAHEFPDIETVAALSQQLSWSHFTVLLPVRHVEARAFYTEQAVAGRLSVRALRDLIGRQGFERKEIANAQIADGSVVPADSFRDPYLLDFLGLKDSYAERDLEEAIVRDLESFFLEAGSGWAFVARQMRMTIGDDDFSLDLLFYSRPLHRLIAVELKLGRLKAAFEGQMKLYLKWLDRHEHQPDEEPPLGLILCTETSREQVELLEMHKDGIAVAEYWIALPPKAALQERIAAISRAAQERIARRSASLTDDAGTSQNRD